MDLRKLRFVLVLFVALGALAFSGCELDEEDADADGGTDRPDEDADGGTDRPDATTTPDTTSDTTEVEYESYRFVLIEDISGNADTIDGGADIDAVVLEKRGQDFYAATVEGFNHGGGFGEQVNPGEAVGAPDAVQNWRSGNPECDLSEGYVSLGGTGGYLILGMATFIEQGDVLNVIEIGGCSNGGIEDEIVVSVSVGKEIDGQWQRVMTGVGPVLSNTVPALPQVPKNAD